MRTDLQKWSVPALLLLTCAISYGLLIPWLGFYWDDWPYTWFAHVAGPGGFKQIFAADRPFLALIYMITSPLLGELPLSWQIFGILCRWLTALVFWQLLQQIWPGCRRQATWTALLFAVFPGFGQQWISVIYSRAYLLLAAHLLSLVLMIKALLAKRHAWVLVGASIFLALFSLFSTEYFFGFELLRPIILWIILRNQSMVDPSISERKVAPDSRQLLDTAWNVLKLWLPYMLMWLAYTVWRAFFFTSENYQVRNTVSLFADPKALVVGLIRTASETLVNVGLNAWTQTLFIITRPLDTLTNWLVLAVALAAAALFWLYLRQGLKLSATSGEVGADNSASTRRMEDRWGAQAALLGLLGILFSIIPFWIAGLYVALHFPWDRFMLAMMLGGSLLFAGLLEYLVKTPGRKAVILCAVLGLSVGRHFDAANGFRRDWNNQQEFFWQLTWRIPGLEPNTMIMTHELPFTYYSDNSLSAPLNWIYAPDLKPPNMPYLLVYTKARLGNLLPDMNPDTAVQANYRAMLFNGKASQSVVIYYSNASCLRVMDSHFTDEHTYPDLPYQLTDAIPLSDLRRIISNPQKSARPIQQYFGPEPDHTWCYYFEKADLARQAGNWQQVIALMAEAETSGFSPRHPSEWLPFIEAYAHLGNWNQAQAISDNMVEKNPETLPAACALWERLASDAGNEPANTSVKRYNCAHLKVNNR